MLTRIYRMFYTVFILCLWSTTISHSNNHVELSEYRALYLIKASDSVDVLSLPVPICIDFLHYTQLI